MQRTKPIWWSDDTTIHLINRRIKHNELFTGKRGAAIVGWQIVSTDMQQKYGASFTEKHCKTKWDNLMTKYRELKAIRSVVKTEQDAEDCVSSWKFYGIMDAFLEQRRNQEHDYPVFIEYSPRVESRDRSRSPLGLPDPIEPPSTTEDEVYADDVAKRIANAEERKALALETMAAAFVDVCSAVTHFLKS